ncbi:cell envelope integrity protein CreD [Opitutus terrae]|uniref:Inner membrane CreD family protein n=1 Tax=Opitutus terrae (strain DSM 11246 / JCM 15787 / PB90-1) TaxID=452637 RepID=B1ZRB3_OPITP|nr:cell envelope integrity protein CreD [Opitutus terrae]ACB74600.1 Inner membrane CreD family protein [Opitutus terrae PB90-1]
MNSLPAPNLLDAARRRLYLFLKIASICVLIGLLHIPLAMTSGVLRERQSYQAAATETIASTWGREQCLLGPVLAVPYDYNVKVFRSKTVDARVVQVADVEVASATAYFLPEELTVNGTVAPEVRRRGIYEAVVYHASAQLSGRWRPDFAAAGIEADRVHWEKARVHLGVSDVHGIRAVGALQVGGNEATFEPSDSSSASALPLVAKLRGLTGGDALEFAVTVETQGSSRITVAPTGKATTVTLASAWPDPSFDGAALPVERSVSPAGFQARWQSSHLSRGFPQHWTDRQVNTDELTARIKTASFGVTFARPIDGYGMTHRAQKYGTLFFVLTFTVFFLFEVIAQLRIHWLQYALVGAALCLFFLAFLALSEFWPTGAAYATAAAACTLMISLYTHTFLRAGRRTLVVLGGLVATYAYLYFVLQSQDYALLAGTAALFVALGLVMFFTRRIDWGTVGAADAAHSSAATPEGR